MEFINNIEPPKKFIGQISLKELDSLAAERDEGQRRIASVIKLKAVKRKLFWLRKESKFHFPCTCTHIYAGN